MKVDVNIELGRVFYEISVRWCGAQKKSATLYAAILSPSINIFKRKFKTYLFSLAFR